MSAGAAARTARRLLAQELRVYVGALRLLGRLPDVPATATPVRYVGAVAAPLWAFTVVSAVELVALHLILPWHTVRLVADVLGIWGVVWCLGYTGCHYVYPHLLSDAGLRVRALRPRAVVELDWDDVERVVVRERSLERGAAVQVGGADSADAGVVSVVVGKRTNLDVRLRRPVRVVHDDLDVEVTELRLFADDPRTVADAWRAHAAAGPPPL